MENTEDKAINADHLSECRGKIDEIDREIVRLFCSRMDITANVAEYKQKNNKPVYDPKRERELMEKVESLAGEDYGSYARSLYESMMALSRANQHRILGGSGETEALIEKALETTQKIFPDRAKVACQGVEGAYSQHAAEKLFAYPSITYYKTFDDVFHAVKSGECRYGVIPLENSTAGSVRQVYDLMQKDGDDPVYIVRSLRLKVDHNLLIQKGAKISGIREIVSHEQALSQSAEYLKNHFPYAKITACANTALAAQMVAESDGTLAALASRDCAGQYGLKIAETDVQDNKNNYTRFICISKDLEIYPGAQKSSIILVTEHKPGALARVLNRFNAVQINLTKLESRPIPGHDFEFMFYFDLDCSVYSPQLGRLLTELEQNSEYFKYLGTYSELL